MSPISNDETMGLCRKMALTAFYHGEINQAESEKRLEAFSHKYQAYGCGLYLVSKSDKVPYVLSFMGNNNAIIHFDITQTSDNRLSLGGLKFNRLCELVTYYSSQRTELLKNECLEYPVPIDLQMEADIRDEPFDELAQLHQSIESQGLSRPYRTNIKILDPGSHLENSIRQVYFSSLVEFHV